MKENPHFQTSMFQQVNQSNVVHLVVTTHVGASADIGHCENERTHLWSVLAFLVRPSMSAVVGHKCVMFVKSVLLCFRWSDSLQSHFLSLRGDPSSSCNDMTGVQLQDLRGFRPHHTFERLHLILSFWQNSHVWHSNVNSDHLTADLSASVGNETNVTS